ncbi:MAG: hypothetical protein NXI32_00740 [bacterium]|nr:hypothetical protein [bacterium]
MVQENIDWELVLGPLLGSDCGLPSGEFMDFAQSASSHSRRAIRLPTESVPELPFSSEPVPWFCRGRFVGEADCLPGSFLQHAAADYYVQDAGSMLALALCEMEPGQVIADVCAAPGGKASAISEAIGTDGVLIANEVIASRFPILQINLERAGCGNFLLTNLELPKLAASFEACCDCVLVDAPCTGQSMIPKGKQSLSAFSPRQIDHSAARQTKILNSAARLVRPGGGRLVYSTCTYSYAENEAIILDFLQRNSDWECRSVPKLAAWQSGLLEGAYRVWPHRDGCAGAFAACLVKTGGNAATLPTSSESNHRRRPQSRRSRDSDGLWTEATNPLDEVDLHAESARLIRLGNMTMLVPNWPHLEQLPKQRIWGTRWAEMRSKLWLPCYGGGRLPQHMLRSVSQLQLQDQEACRYVAGDSFNVSGQASGWTQILWRNRPLGWGKLSHGVLKNHFPKPLRQINARI